jgi:hypothetical protein
VTYRVDCDYIDGLRGEPAWRLDIFVGSSDVFGYFYSAISK